MRQRRGVALIIALLLVALGTLVVAALMEQNQLSVARTKNLMREQQAYAYALGLEAYAIEVLRRDQAEGTGTDSRNDLWNNPMPPIDVPGGRLSGRMRDLNGCLNLNALVYNGNVDAVERARIERLLLLLKLDSELVEALIDWIDPDSTPEPRGAEDLSYLLLNPPYRAANRPLRHVSELRLVRGFDDKAFQAIEPHVCAGAPRTRLNVNTATEAVLQSLVEDMSAASARRLYNNGRANFADFASFQAAVEQEGLALSAQDQETLSFSSTWFLTESMIELDGLPLNYFSLIERQPNGVRVIARSRGGF